MTRLPAFAGSSRSSRRDKPDGDAMQSELLFSCSQHPTGING